ncbi:hypothetical protein BJX65DRAFT_284826 [Aspergillus insuetus]
MPHFKDLRCNDCSIPISKHDVSHRCPACGDIYGKMLTVCPECHAVGSKCYEATIDAVENP